MKNDLFYTDLGKAIFMAENHEITLATEKGHPYRATQMIVARHGKNQRHYVHSESKKQLFPQVGDFCKYKYLDDICIGVLTSIHDNDPDCIMYCFKSPSGSACVRKEAIEILRRENKAFFPADTEVPNDE